jgi:hypothetical protein
VEAYKDGVCQFNETEIIARQRISPAGIWVIGQDQDSYGGGFHRKNAFQGSLTEVNIWDRVLDANEISTLATEKCGLGMQGNYKAYKDIVLHGGVGKFKPSGCS